MRQALLKVFSLFSFLLIFISGCASSNTALQADSTSVADNYAMVIEKNSDKLRKYSGFYNTMDIHATLINSEVAQAQMSQGVALYQWSDTRFAEEKSKFEDRLSKETEVFLSFYTPERKNDDLFKTNTMWKIFIDVGGKRYEGKAKKIKLQLAEIESMYPYHNRFYSPYKVTFPVAMKSIEGQPVKMTVTGVVGSGELNFKN